MADYLTKEDIKAEQDIQGTDDDSTLDDMIADFTAFTDDYCDRTFNVTVGGIRYFNGDVSPLMVDDLLAVDSIKLDFDGDGVYEVTLDLADYHLYPYNKTPKVQILLTANSAYASFAKGILKGVEITGNWGYDTTVPRAIKRAGIMQVTEWWKLSGSGYTGISSSPDFGQVEMRTVRKGLDPNVKMLLNPFVRKVVK